MNIFKHRGWVAAGKARTTSPTERAVRRDGRAGWRHRLTFDRLEDRTVLSPTVFTVTSWGDSPSDPHTNTSGDLRYCIGLANASSAGANRDGSLIQFDPGVFNVPRTITLGGTLLMQNTAAPTAIAGPGSSLLTVSGGGASSNFGVLLVKFGVTASISGLTIAKGHTSSNGGGVSNSGYLTLTDVAIAGNSALDGGGVYNDASGMATLTGVTLAGNSASSSGGGVWNIGTATLTNVTLTGNSASSVGGGVGGGGGVWNDGTATLTNVTLAGNSASSAGGGGVRNVGTATLTGVTLAGNSASFGGGVGNDGTATLTNVTLTGNSASASGGGVENTSTATLTNVTLAGNSASASGGGVWNYGKATINNSIVANSIRGGDFGGLVVYGGNNLIDDAASSDGLTNSVNGNLVGVKPLLGVLGNYGGTTQTVPLLPGSPAIDAGSSVLAVDAQGHPLGADQRGLSRVVGPTVDIGAFESGGFILTVASGSNQSAPVGKAFLRVLQLTVAAKNPGDPVDGGVVRFTPPASGASATLNPSGTVTVVSGVASVAPTANATAGGPYTVSVSAAGTSPVVFNLTNVGAGQPSRNVVTDGSGFVYELDADRTVYRINGASGWQQVRANVTALAADGGGFVYELDADRTVYRINGASGWQQVRANVAALAADGSGFVYELDNNGTVNRRCGNLDWQTTRSGVTALASDASGFVYELDGNGNVNRRCGNLDWQATRSNVASLASDGSGFVYELDADRNVYRRCGNLDWQVTRSNVAALAVSGGFVYALGLSDGTLYRCIGGSWQVFATGVQSLTSDFFGGGTWTDMNGVTHHLP